MEALPTALILAHWQDQSRQRSALPHAPVIAPVSAAPVPGRTRTAAARLLRYLANVVAPPVTASAGTTL
jgi:hypothetical protein